MRWIWKEFKFRTGQKFSLGSPLLNFQNFEGAFLSIRLTQDAETLQANSRGQGREFAVGSKKIRNEKEFSTLLYGMFFFGQK